MIFFHCVCKYMLSENFLQVFLALFFILYKLCCVFIPKSLWRAIWQQQPPARNENTKSKVMELIKGGINSSIWELITRSHLTAFFFYVYDPKLLKTKSCNLCLHKKTLLMIKDRAFQFHRKDWKLLWWLFASCREKSNGGWLIPKTC